MELTIHGYTREELMEMGVDPLRSILHERTHHTIEVMLYRILRGLMEKPENFGRQAKMLLQIWEERGFSMNTPDLKWCKQYVEIADKLNAGESVEISEKVPEPFTEDELKVVEKLLFERRSIRQFSDKPISDEMIRKILYAGIMSPQGCNVDARRFIVLRDPEDWKLVRSDIPLKNCVMILVCEEMSCYETLRFDKSVPQNIFFDAGAAADHICLMAHALGLGACWLTHGEPTQKRIRERFKLPETFVTRCHIVMGWPDEAPIKSMRMSVDDSIIGDLS